MSLDIRLKMLSEVLALKESRPRIGVGGGLGGLVGADQTILSAIGQRLTNSSVAAGRFFIVVSLIINIGRRSLRAVFLRSGSSKQYGV